VNLSGSHSAPLGSFLVVNVEPALSVKKLGGVSLNDGMRRISKRIG
jgi:hypothetical protein